MFSVPSIISHDAKVAEDKRLPLRKLFFSGEPIPESLVRTLYERNPDLSIENLYGGTEFPWGFAKKVDPKFPESANIFEIDENSVPIKIAPREGLEETIGELCVSGPVLFSGYLTNDGNINQGPRIEGAYPTGDAASVRGNYLTLHGRTVDNEVKIQGIRVDPKMVERELEKDPNILEVVAIPKSEEMDIYYVLRNLGSEYQPSMAAAYEHKFHEVPDLPRTPSGKKDRKRLKEGFSQ